MNDILEKIKKLEALIDGAMSDGELNAAKSAKERLLKKYPISEIDLDASEFTLYSSDNWHKKLLLAICRKYGVKPYRYKRQKHTTVTVKINKKFLNNVLWKEYLEYSTHLEILVEEITDSLIAKIHVHEEEDLVHGRLK